MNLIYRLQAFGYTAEVVPCYGMNCIRLSDEEGTECLKTPTDVHILGEADAYLWGMPVLCFPNRISGGRFLFEGREYRFPVNEPHLDNYCHGTLHTLPFAVAEYDGTHITGVFEATEEQPYMSFPHSFVFRLEYRLTREGLLQVASVTNTSHTRMPFALAFHTTFRVPFSPGGEAATTTIKVPTKEEFERTMHNFRPTGKRFATHEWKEALHAGSFVPGDYTISRFYSLEGNVLSLSDATGTTITYTYDKKYRHCMMYNGGNKSYICLEPQTYATDCINLSSTPMEDGLLVIEPGETLTLKTRIAISHSQKTKQEK